MYEQSLWFDLQFLWYRVSQTEIGNYASFFALLPPTKNQKNQNFEKMKKNCWRYHHFTQVYQKPQSYEVQFLRQNFFSFWVNFCHFTPLTTEKIKIKKKWKKNLEMSSFYTCVPKITIMWYGIISCFLRYGIRQT